MSGVVAAAMAGIVGAASAVTGAGTAQRELHPASNDADTITACADATPGSDTKKLFFASGTPDGAGPGRRSTSGSPRCCSPPTASSGATAGSTTRAAARTATGSPSTRWTRPRTRTVVQMAGFGYEGGWGCPADNELVPPDCDTISFSLMERRSDEVARVDVDLLNGEHLTTGATNGFYAFEYEGPAGDLRPVNKDGVTEADGGTSSSGSSSSTPTAP